MTDLDLEQQIATARAEVLRLDQAYQQAWAVSPQAVVKAEAAYNIAFNRLGALVKRKLAARRA